MKKIRTGVVAVAVLLAMLVGTLARAQVMQQIPADAMMVIKINNLKAVSDKLGKLSQDLGVAAMLPPAADPLAFAQGQLHMQNGIDTAGELAVVVLDPATLPPEAANEPVVILVPITDAKAFLGNWPDAKPNGNVTEIKFATGEKGYVSVWGKYAAIAPNAALAGMKVTGGLTAPSATAKQLASKDIILYANFNSIRGKILPAITGARPQVDQTLDMVIRQTPQMVKFGPVLKAVVGQMFTAVETFVNDAEAASVGLSFVPEGINTTVMAEFKQKSYLGDLYGQVKNTDAQLLTGLPKGKYLAFGGSQNDSAMSAKLIEDFAGPIVKELSALGPDMAPAADYIGTLKTMAQASKSGAFGLLAPTGALGAESLIQVIAVGNGDAKVLMDCNSKMMKGQIAMMQGMGLPGMEAMKPVFTPGAKTIDGVTFDSMVTKMEMNPQNRAAMQQAQVLNMMYGPAGQVLLFGGSGDRMYSAMCVSDAVISSAIATAKANQAPLADSDNVKAVSAQLPRQRVGVMYINVGDIATTGLLYAKQFGLALPVQIAPDLPPVGIAISTEGTAIRIDSHVPTALVQSLVAAGLSAQMQMQGGGMPPGGGL